MEQALTHIPQTMVKMGMLITFRVSTTKFDTYQLVSFSRTGTYAAYYLSPDNWEKQIDYKILRDYSNEYNISKMFPISLLIEP